MSVIEGLKLLEHNAAGQRGTDDHSYPFHMELICRPPGFMEVAFAMIHGNERVVVIGKTRAAIDQFIERNGFKTHPRLIRLTVTDRTTGQTVLQIPE